MSENQLMLYGNQLYPVEIVDVMVAVLNGTWAGGNPEETIDLMLADFYTKQQDKRDWAMRIAQAVKQLGCLDCVFARLNLECLLEPHEGDRIVIRYDRQRLLPGENHGVGCGCRACIYKLLEMQVNGLKLADRDKALLDQHCSTNTTDHSAPASERSIAAEPDKHQPDCGCKQCVDGILKMKEDGWNLPDSKLAVIKRAVEIGYTAPMLTVKPMPEMTPEKAERLARARKGDYATGEQGPDGEEVVAYPEDQEALDDLEANFYASEKEIKREPPRPTLTPERKIEIMELIRRTGFTMAETREKAWERLEKLLKKRSPEQNIIGRLAYLIIFEAFRAADSRKFLSAISPRGLLPNKFDT